MARIVGKVMCFNTLNKAAGRNNQRRKKFQVSENLRKAFNISVVLWDLKKAKCMSWRQF